MSTRHWIIGNIILILIIILSGFVLSSNLTSEQNTVAEVPTTSGQAIDVEYTLKTFSGGNPMMAFVGVGGDIDGLINPELKVKVGEVVKITLINGDPIEHDLTLEVLNITTGSLYRLGEEKSITFTIEQAGEIPYFCAVAGHREMGMEGRINATN